MHSSYQAMIHVWYLGAAFVVSKFMTHSVIKRNTYSQR
jgi:hypothetical protein